MRADGCALGAPALSCAVRVVCGGVIPPQDYAELRAAGAGAIFGPGTRVTQAARDTLVAITASLPGTL